MRISWARVSGWAGFLGPAAFVSAWVVGGVVTDHSYDPTRDTISRLAAIGSDTRTLMSAGMVAFGSMMPIYASVLRRALPGWAWATAAATGISTLFVATLPVDQSDLVDRLHFAAAGIGYVTLAVTPLLAARPLIAAGERRLATLGLILSTVSAIALPVSLTTEFTGLFQRIGLTSTDIWIVASVPAVIRLNTSVHRLGL